MGNQVSFTGSDHIHSALTTPRKPDTSCHPHAATEHTGSYLQRLANAINIVPYIQDCLQRAYAFITGNNYPTPSHQQIKERSVSLLPDSAETGNTVHSIIPAIDNDSITEPHSTSNTPQADHQKKATQNKKRKNRRKNKAPVPKEQTIPTVSSPSNTNTLRKPENPHSTKETEIETEIETDTTYPEEEWLIVKPKKSKKKLEKSNNDAQERLPGTRTQKELFRSVVLKGGLFPGASASVEESSDISESSADPAFKDNTPELFLTEANYKEIVGRDKDKRRIPYNQYKKIIIKSEKQLTDNDRIILGKVFCRLLKNPKYAIPVMFKSLSIYQHHSSFISHISGFYPSALHYYHIHSNNNTQDKLNDLLTRLLDIFHFDIIAGKKQKQDLDPPPETTLAHLGYNAMPAYQRCHLFMLFNLILTKKNKANPEPNPINKPPTISQAIERKAFMAIIPEQWLIDNLDNSLKAIKEKHNHRIKCNQTNSTKEPENKDFRALIMVQAYLLKLNIKMRETESDQLKKDTLDSILEIIANAMTHIQYLDEKTQDKWKDQLIYQNTIIIDFIRYLYPYAQATKELEKAFSEAKKPTNKKNKARDYQLAKLSDNLCSSLKNQLDEAFITSKEIDPSLVNKLKKYLLFFTDHASSIKGAQPNQCKSFQSHNTQGVEGTSAKISPIGITGAKSISSALPEAASNELAEHCSGGVPSINHITQLIHRIKLTIFKSAIARFQYKLNNTRDTSSYQQYQYHIKELEKQKEEAIEWLKQQEQNTSGVEKTSHTQAQTEEITKIYPNPPRKPLKPNELFTLEMIRCHAFYENYDEAIRLLMDTVFSTQTLAILKAKWLHELGMLDESIVEYKRFYEQCKKENTGRSQKITAGYAMTLHSKYKKEGNSKDLWTAYDLILEVLHQLKSNVIHRIKPDTKDGKQSSQDDKELEAAITHQTHEAAMVHSGTLLKICQSIKEKEVPLKNLQRLLLIYNVRNWDVLFKMLANYHKPEDSPLSPQAIEEICKTTSTLEKFHR